jgi:hypothetical protein
MPDISELESCISSLSNDATPDIYELNQNASFSKGLEDTTQVRKYIYKLNFMI